MTLTTAISQHRADGLTVRGHDLTREIVGHRSFGEMLYLLLCARLPSRAEASVLDACLVTLMEAGINASTVVARVTAGAQPGNASAAIAAGLLTVGDKYAGSAQACGDILAAAVSDEPDRDAYLRKVVRAHRERRSAVPGFGHGSHTSEDPRAVRLLDLAAEAGVSGAHVEALHRLSAVLDKEVGRHIVVNTTGAMAAVLLDAGLPRAALASIAVVARSGGLAAHVLEEAQKPTSDRIWQAARDSIAYEPPAPGKGASHD